MTTEPDDKRKTILLVDDDDMVRGLLRTILDLAGYNMLEAAGGQAALELAAQHGGGIDLLLTDMMMPGMNGAELAQRMEAQYPGLRVMYISGYLDNPVVQLLMMDQRRVFLPKPIPSDVLASKVGELLRA